MAAAGEKTPAHSELKRSLIGAFHGAFIPGALSLAYSFQNKHGGPLRASWRLRSAFFRVWDLQRGQNSGLIVWKNVTVPLEGKHSKIVHRFHSCFYRCSACVLRYPRSSFSHPSVFSLCFKVPAIEFQPNQLLHTFINAYDKLWDIWNGNRWEYYKA